MWTKNFSFLRPKIKLYICQCFFSSIEICFLGFPKSPWDWRERLIQFSWVVMDWKQQQQSIFSYPHVISTVEVFNAKHNSRVEMLQESLYMMAWVDSSVCFCVNFVMVAKVAMIHMKTLARFGYKLNIKLLKQPTWTIFGYLLEPWTEIWRFLFSFDEFWLFKISKKNMILALHFSYCFFGYM
jgi:hypothetical protein